MKKTLQFQGRSLTVDEAREMVPGDGLVARGRNGDAVHVFTDQKDLTERADALGVDPTTAVPLRQPSVPEPVYVAALTIEQARSVLPHGIVYSGPQSQETATFYVFESEEAMREQAQPRLGLDPTHLEEWLKLTRPSKVVFEYRGRDLTLDELKQMNDPTVLAGPTTETDGRFFVYDPEEDLVAQAKRIGLDPTLMREWKESQNVA